MVKIFCYDKIQMITNSFNSINIKKKYIYIYIYILNYIAYKNS